MKKTIALFFMLLVGFPAAALPAQDADAYILYQKANEYYRMKDYVPAKDKYLELVHLYPASRFTPYALYMLSFLESDTVRVIEYLSTIQKKYPEFPYYDQAREKLGDVYYVLGNHSAALEQYKNLKSERSLYMLSLIYSSDGYVDDALKTTRTLLDATTDNRLAYKAVLIRIKILLEQSKYAEAVPEIQQAVALKPYAFDNGARALFYAGKYYYYRADIEHHFEKSRYIFNLLKTQFPLAVESTLAGNYLADLARRDVAQAEAVRWVADAYADPVELPYRSDSLGVLDDLERKAESVGSEAEGLAAGMVKGELLEYVIRIGEYKDLSLANLAAMDIARTGLNLPIGIYYRNDLYFAEVRGYQDLEKAKETARKLIALGYTDTRVIEFTRVVEYGKE